MNPMKLTPRQYLIVLHDLIATAAAIVVLLVFLIVPSPIKMFRYSLLASFTVREDKAPIKSWDR